MHSAAAVNAAVQEVACRIRVESGAPSWRRMSEAGLWRELVACVLGSATRYENANRALAALAAEGCLNATARGLSQARLRRTLKEAGYRFPGTRAEQIMRSAKRLYANGSGLRAFLERRGGLEEARSRVVENVHGLGPKQASLFLRNIGYSEDVAVLDTHVLGYMRLMGATDCVTPPSSLRRYTECELEFRTIAKKIGLSVAVADVAVWVVMRVISREAAWRS